MTDAVEAGVNVLQCADGTSKYGDARCKRKDEKFQQDNSLDILEGKSSKLLCSVIDEMHSRNWHNV